MPNRHKNVSFGYYALRYGTRARVKSVAGGYPLPDGLADGDEVTILSFDCSYAVVKDEARFTINPVNIAEHFDTKSGKWEQGSSPKNPGPDNDGLKAFTEHAREQYRQLLETGRSAEAMRQCTRETYRQVRQFGFVGTLTAWEWHLKKLQAKV